MIRDIQEKDLTDIKEIYSLYYQDEKDLDHFVNRVKEVLTKADSAIQSDLRYLVAEIDNKVVGVIGFRKPPEKLLSFTKTSKPVELYSLFVKERQKGVGRPLVDLMVRNAKESGYTEIVVYSSEKWKDSWVFYDKLGFTRVGTLDVGGNGQVWTKILN